MDGVTLGQLAARFGLVLKGDPDARVTSVASLKDARAGTLSFLTNPHFRKYLADTAATAVVLDAQASEHCPVAALVTDNPYAAYARIAALLHPEAAVLAGVHADASVDALARVAPSAAIGACAVIEAGAEIGARASIGAGAVIGVDARVGADTRIGPRVVLYRRVRVGSRCVIHAGAVLGADGFGIAQDRDGWVKVPQLGSVVVGDDVEIGANTTIDRGAIDDTVIEDDVKLDNLIQIGHNCRIGAHTAIAGCTGISGSTTVGRRCMIAGAVGIAGHLEIADDTVLLGMSVVTRSLTKSGVYASGIPVSDAGDWRRAVARLRHLDELFDRVRHLERPSGGTEPA